MNFTLTQIILSLFLFFALSRVYLRFKGGDISLIGFIFWTILFGSAVVIVLFPLFSTDIARIMGIGRGVDAIVYTSIVLLFYLVFRLYIYLQDIRQEITELVQKLALKEGEKNEKKSSTD
jgi:hypothetical protein